MRLAEPKDADAITACLRKAPHQAMFQLQYLHRDGMKGQDGRHISFWINDTGPVTDVLGLSSAGMVMPFLPQGRIPGAVRALTGQTIHGMIGPADQVDRLRRALELDDADTLLDTDEPHLTLDLLRLVVPEGPGALCPLEDAPKDMMLDWMTHYQTETLGAPAEQAPARAQAGYDNALRQNNRRVLIANGEPLAMTAFNAQLPDMVQIGGVFTPPALRGRGHARRVVALHLAEALARGVTHATLAAANDAARKAYEAIGFRQVSRFAFVMFSAAHRHE